MRVLTQAWPIAPSIIGLSGKYRSCQYHSSFRAQTLLDLKYNIRLRINVLNVV
jgi:hypothetical protein